MNLSFRLFWYLIISIISVIALILKLTNKEVGYGLKNFEYAFLVGTSIYSLFMHINSILLANTKSENEYNKKIKASNFFRDTIFKFLFVFIIGILFINQILDDLDKNFSNSPFQKDNLTWQKRIYGIYLYYCLPLIYIFDLYFIIRTRCPNPTIDIIIIFIICLVNFLLDYQSTSLCPNLGSNIKKFIFSFNAFIIYDYCLFKKNGGAAKFTLLYAK